MALGGAAAVGVRISLWSKDFGMSGGGPLFVTSRLCLAHSFPAWFPASPYMVATDASVARGQPDLLLVRSSYRSGWHWPGGGVRRGETPKEAARRELTEEIGLSA
jgi:hypothetical protein